MIVEIPIDQIQPNPFQTRQEEDQLHVKNLALSIAAQGLLQIPSARLIVGAGKPLEAEGLLGITEQRIILGGLPVQLAFGHSRLAAFKWLRDVQPISDIKGDFTKMQINLVELTDLQMFQAAVSENLDRKNLTVIEEARAMQTYREKFAKTSAEIGELFHLSDSAVRNKGYSDSLVCIGHNS